MTIIAVITLVTDAIDLGSLTFQVASITSAVSSYTAHSTALTFGGGGCGTPTTGAVGDDTSGARSASTSVAESVEIIVRGGCEAYPG